MSFIVYTADRAGMPMGRMTYGDVQPTVLSGTATLGARETFDRRSSLRHAPGCANSAGPRCACWRASHLPAL